MANDWLGNKELAKQGVLDGNLSYYVVSRPHLKTYASNLSTKDIVVIPPVDDIISCFYFPYMDYDQLLKTEVDYDEGAYPLPYNDDCVKSLTVTRINHISGNGIVDVGSFPKYPITGTTIGGNWNWRNEGKLWLPPFTTITAYDGLTEPFEVNPILTPDSSENFTICCRHSLNHLGAYTLYVDGYRGSSQGYLYGHTCTGLSFPVVSSAYTTYMHENQFNLKSQRYHNFMDTLTGVVGSLFSGDIKGAVSTVGNSLTAQGDSYLGEINSKLSGYQLSGEGSNALHDLQFYGGFQVAYQQYLEPYMEQIGLLFHQYGYAQNKMLTPNIKTRRYFNYIKTRQVNLKGNGIPKTHLMQLKNIFDSGVTVWHMDTSNNFIGNYTPDNTER